MNGVSSEELEGVAAPVGAIQRIAMAIVELPQEERSEHYTVVRTSLAAAIVDDPIANAGVGQNDRGDTSTGDGN
jgi:hypothetical protein